MVDELVISLTGVAVRQENVSAADYFFETSGIYLLPEPIPYDGAVLQLRVFGFLNDESLEILFGANGFMFNDNMGFNQVDAYLYIVVYRPDPSRNAYNLIKGPILVTHQFAPAVLPKNNNEVLGWPVKEGDKVGVYIPERCMNESSGILLCPSQANLDFRHVFPNSTECRSAFYSPTGLEGLNTISVDQFSEVQVRLNMEVKISKPSKTGKATCTHY